MSPDYEFERARERAVAFIGLDRNKSSGRIRDILVRDGYAGELIEAVLAYLREIDYLNDERAADKVISRYNGRRMCSRRAMKHHLFNAGVSSDIIGEKLKQLPSDEASCRALLVALYPEGHIDDRQKALRTLARRGYSFDVAAHALATYRREA